MKRAERRYWNMWMSKRESTERVVAAERGTRDMDER